MRMIMYPAKPVVEEVGRNNEDHRRNEQPGLVMNEENLKNEQCQAYAEQGEWHPVVVVPAKSVVKRPGTDQEGQYDHSSLESDIMNDINAEQGKG